MTVGSFRIESSFPFFSRYAPAKLLQRDFEDSSLAVALAAKALTQPRGQEIRVVHVPSGEVVFRTRGTPPGSTMPIDP